MAELARGRWNPSNARLRALTTLGHVTPGGQFLSIESTGIRYLQIPNVGNARSSTATRNANWPWQSSRDEDSNGCPAESTCPRNHKVPTSLQIFRILLALLFLLIDEIFASAHTDWMMPDVPNSNTPQDVLDKAQIEPLKKCPKCQTDMEGVFGTYVIPRYIDHDHSGSDRAAISSTSPLSVSVHLCPKCRYVEMWA
jgi:hypothetical protein